MATIFIEKIENHEHCVNVLESSSSTWVDVGHVALMEHVKLTVIRILNFYNLSEFQN